MEQNFFIMKIFQFDNWIEKKGLFSYLYFFYLLFATVHLFTHEDTTPFPEQYQDISCERIYIHPCEKASLVQNPDKDYEYLLKIDVKNQKVVFFTDNPQRDVKSMPIVQFIKKWTLNAAFDGMLPNAVISYMNFKTTSEDGEWADVLQLGSPRYDQGAEEVIFEANPLHEYEISTGDFENVVIVYDGVE